MSNSKTPIILDKVASLTTIRDVDIFEFSFMKTLANMLNVNDISLYKFNGSREACRLIRYLSETEVGSGKKRVDEAREVHIEDIAISATLKSAIEWIESTGKTFTAKVEGEFLTVYPVVSHSHNIGYLSVALAHELSEADNLVITSLLSISENFHSLLEENQKDKLTGLLNRKTFDESISKIQDLVALSPQDDTFSGEEKRGEKGHTDRYWLSIIDIDHFKKINDSFGHVYGDEVLLMLSQIMKKSFRPTDLLFRFGGEEFIVIASSSNQEEAHNIFERFRVAMENFVFPQVGQVTISLGATEIQGQYIVSSEIVGKADQALYHAKGSGRNKLFFYEDLVTEGVIIEEEVNDGGIELF